MKRYDPELRRDITHYPFKTRFRIAQQWVCVSATRELTKAERRKIRGDLVDSKALVGGISLQGSGFEWSKTKDGRRGSSCS